MNEAAVAKYWHKIDQGKIQCDLCPRHCRLREGKRGFCFVRENRNGKLVLSTYGRSSGFADDPIEKKPLYHFLPGSRVLSFGTAGCNLSCKFCQNWHISHSRRMEDLSTYAPPSDIAESALRYRSQSVAFTYNDPVIFAEYAMDTAAECRKRGIHTVAVTAGQIHGQAREDFFAAMDAANVDLKSFDAEFYRRICGGRLDVVLETLQYIHSCGRTWLEITTLLIPGHNDSPREIDRLTEWIARHLGRDIPLHFSAFHPDGRMTQIPRTSSDILFRARDIAGKNGLRYVYTGNILSVETGSTWCPHCRTMLIRRDSYRIGEIRIRNGRCRECGEHIPGVFIDAN